MAETVQTSAIGPEAVALSSIRESKTNPRTAHDPHAIAELAASIAKVGVLQPILVRRKGAAYEIVCGLRRARAAREAGLEAVPAIVRELSDLEVVEIQVIENLQRADLHPLEEAQGYHQLMRQGHYDAARIAERVGRSVKYVYDRIKLLDLTRPLQEAFRADRITAGHAILLARLDPKDQTRALELSGALFTAERTLWDPNADDPLAECPQKAVSVRELAAWIDEHVRFSPAAPDPMLFPETAAALEFAASRDKPEKVVPITHDAFIQPEAREGRTFGPRSWKRADGLHKSKPCDRSVLGVVVVGPGRGDAFRVCIAKEKCAVHWGAEQRDKAKRAKESAKAGGSAQERWKREDERRRAEAAKEEERRKAWTKALPAILEAVAKRVAALGIGPNGPFDQILIPECRGWSDRKAGSTLVARGKTAEDLVRHLAFFVLSREARRYDAAARFPKIAKSLGIDVKEILAPAASPAAKAAKKKAVTKQGKKPGKGKP